MLAHEAPTSQQATPVVLALTLPGTPEGGVWTAGHVVWCVEPDGTKYQHVRLLPDPRRPGWPRFSLDRAGAVAMVREVSA